MVTLDKDWLTEGLFDYEYKKYVLLAYIQKVEKRFDNMRLYPYFSDLLNHYNNIIEIRDNKRHLEDMFPKTLIGVQSRDPKLIYEDIIIDSPEMELLGKVIDFAIPEMEKVVVMGKFIYDEVERCIEIIDLGVTPINRNNGYFIISSSNMDVYSYEFVRHRKPLNTTTLKTKLVRTYPTDLGITPHSIRLDLIESSELNNPSTFIIDTPIVYPINETLLPVTKRLLVKKLLQPYKS